MKHCFVALIAATVMVSCLREELAPAEPQLTDQTDQVVPEHVMGEARVYLSEEMTNIIEAAVEEGAAMTKSPGMNMALEELGVTEMYRLFPHAGEYELRTRREGLHRWYVVKYNPQVTLTKAQTSLEKVDGIEVFEPVIPITNNVFNDLSSDLWGIYNTSYKGVDVNVMPVWENYTVGDKNVIVSVVDNGIDLNHEDLAYNCLPAGKHYNSVDGGSVIYPGDHGTHVAGTIAAVGNNGKGVVGVAGGDYAKGMSGVSLMSCQIFKTNADGSSSTGNSAQAIKFGADNGAVISQNSWGYNYDADGDGQLVGDEYTRAMAAKISGSDKAAVDYFIKYAGCDNYGNQLSTSPMKGGVVIFAAGNDAIANGAPAGYEEVVAVGSIASNGTRSSFSNFGPWVDICAPGTNVLSTVPNGYAYMSGTSMACPHVSGVAALIVSHFGGPGFTNEMLKEKLLNSANKAIVSQASQIGGLVDAYGAFVYGNDKAPAEVADLKVIGRGNNLDLDFTSTGDEDGKSAYGYIAIYSIDQSAVATATPDNCNGVDYRVFTPECNSGEHIVCTIDGLEFEQRYFVKVYAYSYGRNYSEATAIAEESTTSNNAPVITSLMEGEYTLYSYETLNIPLSVVEPDGHTFDVVLVQASEAETLMYNPNDRSYKLVIKGSLAEIGTSSVVISATDSYGLNSTLEIVYVVKDNSAPEIVKPIEDQLMTAKGRELQLDMSQYVTDPDGEQLKYDIEISNPKIAHIIAKSNKLILTSVGYGSTDVQVTAKDARGEKVVFTFKVTVKDPSDPLSLYPNPVVDYLYVGTLDMADTEIVISSAAGKVMFKETMKVSAQEPAKVDMTGYAPGTYSVKATFAGESYTKTVVKL